MPDNSKVASGLWTMTERTILIRMAGEGYTSYDVANMLNRSRCAVLGKAHREGIRFGGQRRTVMKYG